MKFRRSALLAFTGAVTMALVACGNGGSGGFTVCIASEPDTIDPALNSAVDGATMTSHLFSGLMRYYKKNGKLVLENDLAKSITKQAATVVNHVLQDKANESDPDVWEREEVSGVRYTVELKEGLKFSDGSPLTADDFIYSWERASGSKLGADYAFLYVEAFADGEYHNADEANCPHLQMAKVNDTTFTFDVVNDVPYMDQFMAFPTFFPVKKEIIEKYDKKEDGAWATKPSSYVSSGPYKLTAWKHNSYIRMEKNPNYWDADSIKLGKITFALSDDDNAILASYKSGKYKLINSVPQDQIDALKRDYPNEFVIGEQLGTYYICFNVNSQIFTKADTEAKRASLRRGLSYFFDRDYLVKNVSKGGQTPANAFVGPGFGDANPEEQFYDKGGEDGNSKGYFPITTDAEAFAQNIQTGIDLIKAAGYTFDETNKKFTDFPAFTYLINTSSGHQAIAEYVRDALVNYGITVNIDSQEWNSFLQTRKQGQFDVARNGWVADYNDPSTMLSLWQSNSGNNDCQLGKGSHKDAAIYSADLNNDGSIGEGEQNLTWAQSFDALMAKAAKETDAVKRFKILHNAETLLMSTGAVCPIYYYTDIYMLNSNYDGFYTTPLGLKLFMYVTEKAAA